MKAPVLSEAQWDKIAAHVETMRRPDHYRFLLLLVRRLGLRPLELAGLQRKWFRGSELRIPIGHSKGGSGRSLPIPAFVMDELDAFMGDRQGSVFVNEQGQAFSAHQMSASVRRMMDRAGVLGSAYSGRRCMATSFVDEGKSIRALQKALGHAHLQTTAHYAEVSETALRDALWGE